jgi:ubiquinone/menaquinone biosynthesis C-methylase UbiE
MTRPTTHPDPQKEFYSLFKFGNLFLLQQRERAIMRALRWAGVSRASIEQLRILEVGCGTGGLLPQLAFYGASPALLHGVDLDRSRLEEASRRYASMRFGVADVTALPLRDGAYDVVVQSTLFTSLLDPESRRRAALELQRVLRPGGFILWFDFRYNSPRNHRVRGIRKREIVRDLFPGARARFFTTMLLPPLARRLAAISAAGAAALSLLPPLRSHYCAIILPAGTGRSPNFA